MDLISYDVEQASYNLTTKTIPSEFAKPIGMEDDEDTFVTIGTPLEFIDEGNLIFPQKQHKHFFFKKIKFICEETSTVNTLLLCPFLYVPWCTNMIFR